MLAARAGHGRQQLTPARPRSGQRLRLTCLPGESGLTAHRGDS
jgi:hypothetical protein